VEYKTGTESRNILKKYGFDVTFKDFEGGHTVPEEILKQVTEWMKK
jgi:predicted esterase